jgi:tetratricopeptide (TPR) repeat protein
MKGTETQNFDCLVSQATEAHKVGDHCAAETFWRRALKIKPEHSGALLNLGVVLARKGCTQEALKVFDQVLELVPGHAPAHANKAGALRALGDASAALASYEQAVLLDEDFLPAYSERGDLLFRMGRYCEAFRSFRQALLRRPDFYPALKGRGLASLALGDNKTALDDFVAIEALQRKINGPIKQISLWRLRHDRELCLWRGAMEEVRLLDALEVETRWTQSVNDLIFLDDRWQEIFTSLNRPLCPTERPDTGGNPLSDDSLVSLNSVADKKGVKIVDNLLTPGALQDLRTHLMGSPIWHDFTHIDGFVATYLESGLASPLMFKIVASLRATETFKDLPLAQGWAFKGLGSESRIGFHADDARLSINFWITPDTANLGPGHGGLIIHRAVPPRNWKITNYDQDRPLIENWIATADTDPIEIPYKENRAIIFDSRLFHGSGPVRFKDNYEGRRINMTLLFGFPNVE